MTADSAVESVTVLWNLVRAVDRPRRADVELWRCALPRLDGAHLDEAVGLGWLTAGERAAAERKTDAALRGRFGGRRILRRLVAAASLGQSPAQVTVTARCDHCGATGHGPPAVLAHAGETVRMSTSSFGDRAVIALSRASVGVDIESPGRLGTFPLERMAHAIAGWRRVSEACPPGAAATEVWAAVEALAKTTGHGLRASEAELERALGSHRLVWSRDEDGLITCVATSVPGASVATIDVPPAPPTRPR